MSLNGGYAYSRLTVAVADKDSPLRRHLEARFPNRAPLQKAYRGAPSTLRVPGGPANPGTLGAAFDFLVRTVLDPTSAHTVAAAGFFRSDHREVISGIIDIARRSTASRSGELPEELLRALWSLALCTEVLRAGLHPGSPLQSLVTDDDFTTKSLLELAPDNAIKQLQQLHLVAVDKLYSHLPGPESSYLMGPTFRASGLCGADADFIVAGRLVEVKTRLGKLNKSSGQRSDALSLEDIYQILSYALFDTPDQFEIRWLSLYSARYGQLTTWSLRQYMEILSGRALDLTEERVTVWGLLGGDPNKV